jgi:outer membrane protein assembly factor BamB
MFDMTRLAMLAVVIGAVALAASVPAPAPAVVAQAGLVLSPAIGPPTTQARARGLGFAAREVVVLFFDGVEVGSDVTGPTGKFNTRFQVPASARPGDHVLQALGRSSGISARAVFLVRTDWSQGCFEAGRSCFNPYENVLDPGNVGGLRLVWRSPVETDGTSAPVYANGKIFVGTATGLVALDPSTGAIIINYRSGPVSTTAAVIHGFDPQPDPPGKVIFGTADGNLQAVSTDGTPLWKVGLGRVPTSPLVIQGADDPNAQVVVGAGNVLYAFHGDGNRQWATVLEGGDISTPPVLLALPASPSQVVVTAGATLYALDVATGAVVWSSTPSGSALGAPSVGNPNIVGDPNILVGDQTGTLFSLNPRTGAVIAGFSGRGAITASPAVGDPNISAPFVFLGDRGGDIYAIDSTNEFPPPIWLAALGGPVDGPPVLANGVLYAATDPEEGGNPHMVALDQADGRVLFDTNLPGDVPAGPIVTDGRVIVATRSGDVLAYQGPDS